jgi:hypothetical protein
VQPLSRRVNYRQRLLSATEGFLEGTSASIASAHQIIKRCHASLRAYTVDDLMWGPIVSTLQDSIFYGNPAYLSTLKSALQGLSNEVQRAYVRYDFRTEFTREERAWYEELLAMTAFLAQFPFSHKEGAVHEYDRRSEELRILMQRASTARVFGTESIYHVVLREATEIVTHINVVVSLLRYEHLIPGAPYSTIDESEHPPDVSHSVTWTARALQSMSGADWLLFTWRLGAEQALIVH